MVSGLGVITEDCKLLGCKVGACPLKSLWVTTCPHSFSCTIKRKNKHNKKFSVMVVKPVCGAVDCSNNINGKCDAEHEMNKVGECIVYKLNKKWFIKSLAEKVKGGLIDIKSKQVD